jgi:mono/diheme cytochrome c family protein
MRRFLAPIAGSLTLMVAATGLLAASGSAQAPVATTQRKAVVDAANSTSTRPPAERGLLNRYCAGCHNDRVKSGNFVLDGLDISRVGDNPEAWEKVVRKLRGGVMPPPKQPRPDEAAYAKLLSTLQERLDQTAAAQANPGRTETVHRLNRFEYESAVRDLLAVQVNAEDLLPADDSSYGFDNIAGVLKMSQALMERYLTAARVVSRSAIGSAPPASSAAIYRVPPELQQHDRIDALPFGTRGGTLIRHVFPLNAEYDIKVTVTSGRNSGGDPQQLEITLDGAQLKLFTLAARDPLTIRVPVSAVPTTSASRSSGDRWTSSSRSASRSRILTRRPARGGQPALFLP